MARRRAAWHKCLVLLASATPCTESFWHARRGDYTLLTLRARYGAARLPDVTIVDMNLQEPDARSASLSPQLIGELGDNLARGEQSILLLNRRGYNTLVKCAVCQTVAECPNCSVALTYHSANGHLMCHYCGYTARADAVCRHAAAGSGVFRAPAPRRWSRNWASCFRTRACYVWIWIRLWQDFRMKKHFADFSAGKYDIIIGTQMVAKGLDFPNVTLVGVLSADSALYAPGITAALSGRFH